MRPTASSADSFTARSPRRYGTPPISSTSPESNR